MHYCRFLRALGGAGVNAVNEGVVCRGNPLLAPLVSMIVPDSDLQEAVDGIANKLASKSLLGLHHMKQLLNNAVELALPEAIEAELDVNSTYSSSFDRNEGLAAFRERRVPEFKGA